jgi:PPP family 3-phenylpropionic acid transporter
VLAVKAQFFLCYAVMGSLLPYLPLHLEGRGLTRTQVGVVMAAMGVAVIITPALVTLLADLRVPARRLLMMLYLLAAATLLALWRVERFDAVLAIYLLHAMAFVPVIPLQDAMFFSMQRERHDHGRRDEPYHHVRVWGTIGFIVPSIALYVLLGRGGDTTWAVVLASVACVLGAINAARLPRVVPVVVGEGDVMPTRAAARRIFSPALWPFTVGMWLMMMATAAYYTFYPAYLVQPRVGVTQEWVGIISSLGVAVEVAFMLGFGWLAARLGIRRLLILAAGATTLRMAMLWLAPSMAVGVGTQLLHGLMVLLMHVVPPVLINRHADATCRNSMQGLFAMAVLGTGRILGNLLAAPLARADLGLVFLFATVLCAAATLLLTMRYRDHAPGA